MSSSAYTAPSAAAPKAAPAKTKPSNVFTNDGSFLERFQRTKGSNEAKLEQDEVLRKKREFDERFKNRRKRAAPPPETAAPPAAKKAKHSAEPSEGQTTSAYAAQVKALASKSLQERDTHIGSRSLVR